MRFPTMHFLFGSSVSRQLWTMDKKQWMNANCFLYNFSMITDHGIRSLHSIVSLEIMMFLLIEKSWHHGLNKTDKRKSCRKKRLNSDAFEQHTWNGLLFIHNSNWRQTVNMAISWLLLGIHYYFLRLIVWLALAQALAF